MTRENMNLAIFATVVLASLTFMAYYLSMSAMAEMPAAAGVDAGISDGGDHE